MYFLGKQQKLKMAAKIVQIATSQPTLTHKPGVNTHNFGVEKYHNTVCLSPKWVQFLENENPR